MKKFLCYLLIATMLITSCVGCGKQTKESDKKETQSEKTDTQDEASDNEKDVETETPEFITSNETILNPESQESTQQQDTKPSTSQSNKQDTTQNNNKQNNNKQNNTNNNSQNSDKTQNATSSNNNITQSNDNDRHTHSYSRSVTKPTCTTQGYTTYTCSCGESYKDDYTSAKGHTEVIDKAVTATTTSTGLTEGKHCSVCGTILVAQEVISKITQEKFFTSNIRVTFNNVVNYSSDSWFDCGYDVISYSCTPKREYVYIDHNLSTPKDTQVHFEMKVKVKVTCAGTAVKIPYTITNSVGEVVTSGSISEYRGSSDSPFSTGSYCTMTKAIYFSAVPDTYTIKFTK